MPTCKFCAEKITGNEINCPHCGSSLGKEPDIPKKTKTQSAPVPFLGFLSVVFLFISIGYLAFLGVSFHGGLTLSLWWIVVVFGLLAVVFSFLKKSQFAKQKYRRTVGIGGFMAAVPVSC